MPTPPITDGPSQFGFGTPETAQVKKTLLVVDDDEGPRDALLILFKNDYNVLLAENGPQAIELVRLHSVDAVVLDLRMPIMSGIEVLNHLKKLDPGIEVVILTAFEALDTARQALRLGACDYLTKPFDIATMREAVATAMERRALSNEIKSHNRKLDQLQEEIRNQRLHEEITRGRGEIYASIIHDINSPLTIISAFVEVINESIGDSARIEGANLQIVKDRIARVSQQVNNCIQLSSRYLSFLRGGGSHNTRVSVNQIFNDLRELLKAHSDARKNSLIIQTLPTDAAAQINGTDLIQILLNLTINAFQSSGKSHQVEVRGRTIFEPLRLSEFVDRGQDRFINRDAFENRPPLLAISVADNGPGIPPEILEHMFEPYFTTKPAGQGTGLGLSIVRRLVEQAHGAIHIHTQMGLGTTFTVYLPAREISPGS
jgi:two-component system sensor histidine kinase/response regulator